ncbi:MAG: tetratricopeptide repeat protein [Acidobacteriota bacterium]
MRPQAAFLALAVFVLGFTFGLEAGKNDRVSPELFKDQDPKDAAANLLDMALRQADDGTWERISVGRMHYLSGDKARGQQIFDGITKRDASDWIRLGRVYWQAGEWDQARDAFERVLERNPKDEDWLAEIGAYYNLKGERAKAEELFERSFAEDPDNLKNTLAAAGSYLGVERR